MHVKREGIWLAWVALGIVLLIVGTAGRFGQLVGCIACPSQLVVDTGAGNAGMDTGDQAGDGGDGGGGSF